jgi:thiosulfate/3-mercaptopyruvate sulfurtransferase
MQKLDISKNATIVVYDNMGIFTVARAAWMMKYFGATNVRILNGGMKKW